MRLRWGLTAVGLVVGLTGCGGGGVPPADARPRAGWSAVPGQAAQEWRTPPPAAPHAAPVRLAVPSIGVHTGLERLALDAQGVLTPPHDPARAGWYAAGVRHGDPGPAIIAGHLDSRTGAAVFAKLGTLKPGADIVVTDARGTAVHFTVESVHTYPKSKFPTTQVYGPTPDPELRLITCGGGFDQASRHYLDNVVVFASLAV